MNYKLFFLALLLFHFGGAKAIVMDDDLNGTLAALRSELTERLDELSSLAEQRSSENTRVYNELLATVRKANQNALMLYSQKDDYIFDITYACREATTL